jgi:hypothetical protein
MLILVNTQMFVTMDSFLKFVLKNNIDPCIQGISDIHIVIA